MKVKSQAHLLHILADEGYRYKKGFFVTSKGLTFNCSMFDYCGKQPPVFFTWRREWLEEDPADCVGHLCDVWNFNPTDTIRRLVAYEPNSSHPFKTANDIGWLHARPLTEEDLK